MRITTLNQLKEYTTYTYYKLNKPEYTTKKKVYICQPINYIDEGCTHMDIWSGYIFYKTNAVSRNVGYYGFLLDKESDETYNNIIKKQPKYLGKISPMWYVNTTLYNVQSEENCKLYKNLKLEENLLTENNKAVFTDKHEIEQYIDDIRNNIIKIPEVEHIVTMKTWYNDKDGNKIEETSVRHLPSGKTDIIKTIIK